MKKRKGSTFQERKIEQLLRRIEELESENAAITKENETNKNTLLILQNSFDAKGANVDSLRENYEKLFSELKEKSDQLTAALEEARALQEKYEREMKKALNKVRRQK